MKALRCILLWTLFFSSVSFAYDEYEPQQCDHTHQWWLNVGWGVGTTFKDTDGLGHYTQSGTQVAFNGMLTDTLFLIFETTTLGYSRDAGSTYYDTSKPSNFDVGLLLGYKRKYPKWYWAGAAGISHYRYQYNVVYPPAFGYMATYYRKEEKGAGLPLQAQIFWTPIKHFGLGLVAHAVASKHSYGVVLFSLQIS